MSDIERILIGASRVEQALRNIGGEGRGLHDLCKSLDKRIPPGLAHTIHQIARTRNQAAHEADRFRIRAGELRRFEKTCEQALREIGRIERWQSFQRPRGPWYRIQWRPHRLGRATVFLHLLLILLLFTGPLGVALSLIQSRQWLLAAACAALASVSAGILAYRRLVSLPILAIVLMAALASLVAIPDQGKTAVAYLVLLLGTWLLAATSA
jgi:hypothetical protein